MFKLPQPLRLPIILIQRPLATINVVRTIKAGPILSIVAAAAAIRVGHVRVGGALWSRRVLTRIRVVHVEGQIIGLRGGESDGVVDAEELVEEAGAFAALDVATAAAGVGVCVEWHVGKRAPGLWRMLLRHELAAVYLMKLDFVRRQ
jgi:hypothetical protein